MVVEHPEGDRCARPGDPATRIGPDVEPARHPAHRAVVPAGDPPGERGGVRCGADPGEADLVKPDLSSESFDVFAFDHPGVSVTDKVIGPMINLLLSVGLGLATFGGVTLWLGPVAGVIPALFVFFGALFLLGLRVQRAVEKRVAALTPMLEARNIKGAQAHIRQIQSDYGRWQFLLRGQLEAQLGMIDYVQMKWDEALPRLQRGQWRNWSAQLSIAAIHFRQGRKVEAWEAFAKAAKSGKKEVIVYGVWAILRLRDGERGEAMAVVTQGLEALPDNGNLRTLKKRIANKKKADPGMFGEIWYQFFPEDMAKKMLVRGRAGPQPAAAQQPRIGARRAPRR